MKRILILVLIFTEYNANAELQKAFRYHPHINPDSRIIGGTEAKPHSAPYMARIFINKGIPNQPNLLSMCGGSLITPSHILTAAHCLKGYRSVRYTVLGAHKLEKDESERIILWGGKHVIHEKYNSPINANDIALIKLPKPVNLNEFVLTIKLPGRSDYNKTYADEIASVYGWGWVHDQPKPVRSSVLMTANVTVISNEECIKHSAHKSLHFGDLCTYDSSPRGTCHGDSGGPLVLNGVQIGVISRGASQSCEQGDPSIFVKTAHYIDWIDKKINEM